MRFHVLRLVQLLLVALLVNQALCAKYSLENKHTTACGWSGTLVLHPGTCSNGRGACFPKLDVELTETKDIARLRIAPPAQRFYTDSIIHPSAFATCGKDTINSSVSTATGVVTFDVFPDLRVTVTPMEATSGYVSAKVTFTDPTSSGQTLMWGVGERVSSDNSALLAADTVYSMWAQDPNEYWRDIPMYGVHPIIHTAMVNPKAHGTPHRASVTMVNSHAAQVTTGHASSAGRPDAFMWEAAGGAIDVLLTKEDTPVLASHSAVFGAPYIPPLWSLGFQQSRYGYSSVDDLRAVINGHKSALLPLDVMYSDVDYMNEKTVFTTSPSYPPEAMRDLLDDMHGDGQRYVAIIDPAIKAANLNGRQELRAYTELTGYDCMVHDAYGMPAIQSMLPGDCNWVDFTDAKAARGFWAWGINMFYDTQWEFDGVWLDQNEPRSYTPVWPGVDPTPTPAWTPAWPLQVLTLPYNATFAAGTMAEYHNTYGIHEVQVTLDVLNARDDAKHRATRPFTVARSTFLGSGALGAHWFGDNNSTMDNVLDALTSTATFSSAFNVHHVGVDIGGFHFNITAPVMTRFIQTGALLPFSRNHNHHNTIPQELYALGPNVIAAGRAALYQRYGLIPALYSAMVQTHIHPGQPVVAWPGSVYPDNRDFIDQMGAGWDQRPRARTDAGRVGVVSWTGSLLAAPLISASSTRKVTFPVSAAGRGGFVQISDDHNRGAVYKVGSTATGIGTNLGPAALFLAPGQATLAVQGSPLTDPGLAAEKYYSVLKTTETAWAQPVVPIINDQGKGEWFLDGGNTRRGSYTAASFTTVTAAARRVSGGAGAVVTISGTIHPVRVGGVSLVGLDAGVIAKATGCRVTLRRSSEAGPTTPVGAPVRCMLEKRRGEAYMRLTEPIQGEITATFVLV